LAQTDVQNKLLHVPNRILNYFFSPLVATSTNLLRKGSELFVVIVLSSWDIPGDDTGFWDPPSCSIVGSWLRRANS